MRHPLDKLQPEEGFPGSEGTDDLLELSSHAPPCVICAEHGKILPATMLCLEMQLPICLEHSAYCGLAGHSAIPLKIGD